MDMKTLRFCTTIEEMGKVIAELNKKKGLKDGDIFFCGEDPYIYQEYDASKGKTVPVMCKSPCDSAESDVVGELITLKALFADMIHNSSSSEEYYAKVREKFRNSKDQYIMRMDHFGELGDVVSLPVLRYHEMLRSDCAPYPGGCWVVTRKTDTFFTLVAATAFTSLDKTIDQRFDNLMMAIDVDNDYLSDLDCDARERIFDEIMKKSADSEDYRAKIRRIFNNAGVNYITNIHNSYKLGDVESLQDITLKSWHAIRKEFKELDDLERVPLHEIYYCNRPSIVCIAAKKFVRYQ